MVVCFIIRQVELCSLLLDFSTPCLLMPRLKITLLQNNKNEAFRISFRYDIVLKSQKLEYNTPKSIVFKQ